MDACLLFQVSSSLAFLSDEGRNIFHVWYVLLVKYVVYIAALQVSLYTYYKIILHTVVLCIIVVNIWCHA
jgi:hypothetical protein